MGALSSFRCSLFVCYVQVMIVDDRVAIVSSANVNDRSMIGSRDSELGAVVSGKTNRGVSHCPATLTHTHHNRFVTTR